MDQPHFLYGCWNWFFLFLLSAQIAAIFKRILTFKVSRAPLGAILCRIGHRELADLGREGMTVGGVEEMVEIWKDGDWQ